ncbi:hypothetical protein DPMN_043927 [Dreissena polymorpha]|uniref:Pappalysin-1 SD scarf domain-containing protein n=2 Tax=Dreissena polymorpha TaxID=45954 RepID=A0A9D4D3N2_DREPO|nr:hypothetical protein DPMN_043927 [Dreissena polymorpha]
MKATLAILGLALFGLSENLPARVVEQWVNDVIGYSSAYGRKFQRWSAQEILGAPNVYPRYADDRRAWAPDVIDANQFLEFQFYTSVYVTKLDVYETFNAGGVKAIRCFDVSEEWITLWSTDKVYVLEYPRIFSPSFTLDIDCTAANTWVEIDAVKLYGTKEEEQWVSGVIGYSSQNGSDNYSAQQILGVPDFQFATTVYVTKVDVYEVYKAGGVKAIKCYDDSKWWITLWSTDQASIVRDVLVRTPRGGHSRVTDAGFIILHDRVIKAVLSKQIIIFNSKAFFTSLFLEPHSAGYRLHRGKRLGADRRCKAARLQRQSGWSAKQTLGVPDVYPGYADNMRAWAPGVIDANQFLMLKFATPVYVTKVDVYETFNAGGVKEIGCFDFQEEMWPNGTMVVNRRWIWLWSTPQVSVVEYARIFSPTFESTIRCFSDTILLVIDCTAANDWVEIDAVRLKGYQESWSRLAKREHVNEVLVDEGDKAVTAVEPAAAKMSIKQLLAHVRK